MPYHAYLCTPLVVSLTFSYPYIGRLVINMSMNWCKYNVFYLSCASFLLIIFNYVGYQRD